MSVKLIEIPCWLTEATGCRVAKLRGSDEISSGRLHCTSFIGYDLFPVILPKSYMSLCSSHIVDDAYPVFVIVPELQKYAYIVS